MAKVPRLIRFSRLHALPFFRLESLKLDLVKEYDLPTDMGHSCQDSTKDLHAPSHLELCKHRFLLPDIFAG